MTVSKSSTSSDIGKVAKEVVDVDGEAVREGTSSRADGEGQLFWSSLPVSRGFSLAIAASVRQAAKVQCAMCVLRRRRELVLLSRLSGTL
jgi:hypothetical protein